MKGLRVYFAGRKVLLKRDDLIVVPVIIDSPNTTRGQEKDEGTDETQDGK